MELSSVSFVILFLLVAAGGWLASKFFVNFLTVFVSATTGVVVKFRFLGFIKLKDVVVKLKKGPVECISIREILGEFSPSLKPSHSRSFFRFRLRFRDVDIVLRPSPKKKIKGKGRKKSATKTTSRGKWGLITGASKFLHVSASDVVIRTKLLPEAWLQIQSLEVHPSRSDSGWTGLGVQAEVLGCNLMLRGVQTAGRVPFALRIFGNQAQEKAASIVGLDSLTMALQLDYIRGVGAAVKHAQVGCGELEVSANEQVLELEVLKASTAVEEVPVQEVEAADEHVQETEVPKKPINPKGLPKELAFTLNSIRVQLSHSASGLEMVHHGGKIKVMATRSDLKTGMSVMEVDVRCDNVQIMRESSGSFLEASMVGCAASIDLPTEEGSKMRAATSLRLDGLACSIAPAKLAPWIELGLGEVQRRKRLKEGRTADAVGSEQKKQKKKKSKGNGRMEWEISTSAPDASLVICSLDGHTLMKVDSSTVFGCASSSPVAGGGVKLEAEVGNLVVRLRDGHPPDLSTAPSPEERGPGRPWGDAGESNLEAVLELSRLAAEWEASGRGGGKALHVGVSGGRVFLSAPKMSRALQHVALLRDYLKRQTAGGRRTCESGSSGHKPKKAKEYKVKLVIDDFGVEVEQVMHVVQADVPDPKKVNFGCQGGVQTFETTPDGIFRVAKVSRAAYNGVEAESLLCHGYLHLKRLTIHHNADEESTQGNVERCELVYREVVDRGSREVVAETVVLDAKMGWVVFQKGSPSKVMVSAHGVSGRWEPDVQFFIVQAAAELKAVLATFRAQKPEAIRVPEIGGWSVRGGQAAVRDATSQAAQNVQNVGPSEAAPGVAPSLHVHVEAQTSAGGAANLSGDASEKKKKKAVAAMVVGLDLEDVQLSAELADGVEACLQVQSLSSEDGRRGVLMEDVDFGFNHQSLLLAQSLEVSLGPAGGDRKAARDVCVQGAGVRVVVPYRQPLRAIEDAVEDMVRVLKLVTAAQKMQVGDGGTRSGQQKSKPKSDPREKGDVVLKLKGFSVEVEEEPIQGWLDEHMHLMRKEGQEQRLRERLLEKSRHERSREMREECEDGGGERSYGRGGDTKSSPSAHFSEPRSEGFREDGIDTPQTSMGGESTPRQPSGAEWNGSGAFSFGGGDGSVEATLREAWERIHRHHAQAYKSACEGLGGNPKRGGGPGTTGFQGGFVSSVARRSLTSVSFEEFEVVLTPFRGGREEMVAKMREMDEVDAASEIPIGRHYGRKVEFWCSGMRWQLRNFPLPLFAATEGRCKGVMVMGAQATIYQPQQVVDVYLGRWRKVSVLRSISGSTPPLKLYSDVVMEYNNAVWSYGVGYEPALYGDLSHVISIAIKKGSMSKRSPSPPPPPAPDGCDTRPRDPGFARPPPPRERAEPPLVGCDALLHARQDGDHLQQVRHVLPGHRRPV